MSQQSPREYEDERRLAERAAEWLSVLKQATPAENTEFADWVLQSPRHLDAILSATAVARQLRQLDARELAQAEAVLEASRAQIVPLHSTRPEPVPKAPPKTWRAWGWPLAAAAALAASVIVWWSAVPGWQTYATAVGEERAIELGDGSSMQLNTRSRVKVQLTSNGRDIRLLDGEAMFKVRHDPRRPFRVHSGASLIEAVGTQFNVLRLPSGTTVSVLEGAVRIMPEADARTPPSQLTVGQQARIALNGQIERRKATDLAAVAAWRQRHLEFYGDSLADIAAEFNRYNKTPQIGVVGDAVRARRYTGAFDAHDPSSLLDFLKRDPQLEFEESGTNLVIRAR